MKKKFTTTELNELYDYAYAYAAYKRILHEVKIQCLKDEAGNMSWTVFRYVEINYGISFVSSFIDDDILVSCMQDGKTLAEFRF